MKKQEDLVREYLSILLEELKGDNLSPEKIDRVKQIQIELEMTHEQIIKISSEILN